MRPHVFISQRGRGKRYRHERYYGSFCWQTAFVSYYSFTTTLALCGWVDRDAQYHSHFNKDRLEIQSNTSIITRISTFHTALDLAKLGI